jgi:PTS system ascorbate-specific IIC component
MYAFMQSIQFVRGIVLYSGVRLLLNELVPAFRGLRCALSRTLSLRSIARCCSLCAQCGDRRLSGDVGSIIGMLVFPMFGLAMILPVC